MGFLKSLDPVIWVVECMVELINLMGFLLARSGPLVAAEPNELGFYGYKRTYSFGEAFLLM